MAFGKAVAKRRPSTLALPEFIKPGGSRGTENIKREDLILPRLALAQKLSPEIDKGSAKFIESLSFGDAYNTLTKEIYGQEPVQVVIVRSEQARYIEFKPIEEGGGIVDFNVPPNDPRTQFTEDEHGRTVKPVATKFLEYVALIGPDFRMPIALSFKSSGLKAARMLNGLIKIRNTDAFASIFSLTPAIETKGPNSWTVFNVALAGNVDEETFDFAAQVYDSLADQTIVTDREEEAKEKDDTPF